MKHTVACFILYTELVMVCLAVLIGLKLLGYQISWIAVFSPIWLSWIASIVLLFLVYVFRNKITGEKQ